MAEPTIPEQPTLTPRPPIPKELIDELLKGYKGPQDLLGEDGLFKRLTAALVNRAMDAELTHHLGYDVGQKGPEGQQNRRHGKGRKQVRTEHGPVVLEVPRDRDGTFEPQIVPKHQRHFDG